MPIVVGPYAPSDFSFSGRMHVVLSDRHLWATAIASSLSVTAIVLALRHHGKADGRVAIGGILSPFLLLYLSVYFLEAYIAILPTVVFIARTVWSAVVLASRYRHHHQETCR